MTSRISPRPTRFRLVMLAMAFSAGSAVGCSAGESVGGSGGKGSGGKGSGGSGTTGSGGSGTTGTGGSGTTGSGGSSTTGSGGSGTTGSGGSGTTGSGGSGTTGTGGSGTTGTGGSGTTGSGGAAGGGTGGAGGGNAGTAKPLSCTDPMYGAVSIPAAAVISDFETNSLHQYVQDGRGDGAQPWYAYAVGDVNDQFNMTQTPSMVNPMHASNKFAVDTTVHGPCSTKGALHVSSPGKAGADGYAGFGIDFMARTGAMKKKRPYDASKYTGVGFWAKCSGKDLQFAFVKTVDAVQDADVDPAVVPTPCTYSAGTCNQYGIKNAAITKDWSYYKVFFSEALQDPNGKTFGSGVDKSKLMAFQIHVNPFSPRTGTPAANAFDCHIDDVHFLTEAAPTPPAATVTWATSGNKIMRNGKEHKIRGLARASLEWDCAGFSINREDIQRMKSWKANTVRLAVKDSLWNGTSTGGAFCTGAAYQRQVKRVISWILQAGMDAILDLHWVGGSPTSVNQNFWDTVTKDAFFKDGRIIYELYNEPTGDFNALRTWMNGTVAKIRANGATNNLVLVGGVDYSYDISGYVGMPISGQGPVAYVAHPYIFKTTSKDTAYLNPAKSLPVVATEFGDANVAEIGHMISATTCNTGAYTSYLNEFETAGMSWTAFAWIVDEWGCGFPQMLADYSGAPNAIGMPVREKLMSLNQ